MGEGDEQERAVRTFKHERISANLAHMLQEAFPDSLRTAGKLLQSKVEHTGKSRNGGSLQQV